MSSKATNQNDTGSQGSSEVELILLRLERKIDGIKKRQDELYELEKIKIRK